jgi:hypothetical protein
MPIDHFSSPWTSAGRRNRSLNLAFCTVLYGTSDDFGFQFIPFSFI